MKRLTIIFSLCLTAILCVSCGDRTPVVELKQQGSEAVKENMINANRVVIQSEATQIEAYIQRRGWQMLPLPCGAQYRIAKQGNGAKPMPDDTVAVTYRLEALDGTPFYTNQTDTLVVGRMQPTVALDELVARLQPGSTACLIAPSGTAYGVVGDGDRVPSRTVIVYNILDIVRLHHPTI